VILEIPDRVGNDKWGGGNDRISYKVKCKRKKEKGTGIATGCALAMTEGLDSRLRGNDKGRGGNDTLIMK